MLTNSKLSKMYELVDGLDTTNSVMTEHGVDVVKQYCYEFLDNLDEYKKHEKIDDVTEKLLLNGADNWYQYSWGGCSLVYNYDLAERLLTADEFEQWKTDDEFSEEKDGEYLLNLQSITLQLASTYILKFWDEVEL